MGGWEAHGGGWVGGCGKVLFFFLQFSCATLSGAAFFTCEMCDQQVCVCNFEWCSFFPQLDLYVCVFAQTRLIR